MEKKNPYYENIWIVPTVNNGLKVLFVCFLLWSIPAAVSNKSFHSPHLAAGSCIRDNVSAETDRFWTFGTINITIELASQLGPTRTAFTATSRSSSSIFSAVLGRLSAFHPVGNWMTVSRWPDHNWTQKQPLALLLDFFFFWIRVWQVSTHIDEIWQDLYWSM